MASQRRGIENALFSGSLLGVVSTNALKLGINVGDLKVCIIAGFPGTIVSTWQQAGRVGRGGRESLVIFIAVENPLDQYFIRNTEALFTRPAEQALIDPNNSRTFSGAVSSTVCSTATLITRLTCSTTPEGSSGIHFPTAGWLLWKSI